jgi:hypothetical protein
MMADPFTKVIDPAKLQAALDTNTWDLRQPTESVVKKRAKQLQRRKTAAPDLVSETGQAEEPATVGNGAGIPDFI